MLTPPGFSVHLPVQPFSLAVLPQHQDVTRTKFTFTTTRIHAFTGSLQKWWLRYLWSGQAFHHPVGCIDPRGWTEYYLRTEDQKKNGWTVETWGYEAPLPAQVPASKFNQVDKKMER